MEVVWRVGICPVECRDTGRVTGNHKPRIEAMRELSAVK
ncbi:unnamed protein product [Wuchereria bancrofti]|uniref:Uncharacterized protein n=1 Tax=Wuchereria bancrofti TaxID=6293 RepID=A0A3P7EPR7_WUCBA|nr:unnamed protein product [Wuchereria bancrofti]